MNSDSEQNQSNSDFNQFNKLNPLIQDQDTIKLNEVPENNITKSELPKKQIQILHLLDQYSDHRPELIIQKKQLTLTKQSKPRLIIDHMILQNFKSYAGTQKIGPFHKNFTSIVGPNGSGKSNLIESMLFIFGFSASWMRLNKLHQLIHNSSSSSNITTAAVEVHFKKIIDHSDGSITQISDSAFFIKRTVNKSSVSKYFLDSKESTQAEVKTKLKSEGIDLTNNRFLILQGEVEQISQMRQKSGDRDKPGFLQYLEDIIGSNQFIQRIEQALKEYNQSQEIKHQKGQRMRIVESQLKAMNSQKEQAIKYVKKQRMLHQIQSVLHQVMRSNSAYELKKMKSKIQEVERKKQQIIKEEKQKLAKQAEKVTEIRRIKIQQQKIDKQIGKDKQKIEEMSLEDNNLKTQITYHSEDQIRDQKKVEEFNSQFNQIVEQSNQIQAKLPLKQKKLKKIKQQIDQMSKQLQKYDKPQLRQAIKTLQNDLKKANFQKLNFTEKKQSLLNQIQKMNSNKEDHQSKLVQFKQMLKKTLQMKAKIQIALEVAQKEFKQHMHKIEEQKKRRNSIKNDYNNLEISLKQKSTHTQEQGHFNNMFNHIVKANIPGVNGRLGDLGTIPRQYDQIITTACSRLDNIVVQNYQAATEVLNLLKRNKLGRVTCIILDKISEFSNYMNKAFNCPKDCVRLFDIIKPQTQKIRTAFYFALSNTLYCQNSDFGVQISMGDDQNRRRVISKKKGGYIIYEMNGLMNSVPSKRGGFMKKTQQHKKINSNDEKQIVKKLQQISLNLQAKNDLIIDYEKKINLFHNNFLIMKSEIVLIEGKIREINQEMKDIQKLNDKNKGKKQNVDTLKKQIQAINKQLIKIQSLIQKILMNLEKMQNQQKKNQNIQISKIRQKYKIQRVQFNKLQKQIEKQQALITSVEKRIKQNQIKKQNIKKKIIMVQKTIQKCKKDIAELENKGLELYKKIQSNTLLKEKLVIKEEELKKTLQTDEASVKQSKKKIQQARDAFDQARRQIRKNQEDFKFACSQLERIRKMYVQMTSTYDFLNNLQQIQNMNLDNSMRDHSSILDFTIQNISSDIKIKENRKGPHKMFDVKKLEKIDPQKDLTEDDLDSFLLFQDKLRSLLSTESTQLKRIDSKNIQIISEFKDKFMDFKEKFSQFQTIKLKQLQLKQMVDQLKEERFNMFRQGFSIINSKLKQVYQLLTNGGDAELEMIDSLDPFSDGVNFSVRPPKKAWKQINKLSGGEKTLSSLSLIFALHYYKPTPLYFMDQIDAALDFKNVLIVGDYIKKRTKDAQFIIISLRNNMFDLADKLVGVYKTYDKTNVINLAASKLLAKRQLQKKQKENQNQNIQKAIRM